MVADRLSHPSVTPELAAAVDRWSRTVPGAPRRLSTLVTAVEPCDEVLHRVLTDVVRRELREERASATERTPSAPRIPLSQVDPFVGTLESLRADTFHIAVCGSCSSFGVVGCSACGGRQTVSCSGCGGVGKFRNPQTNRLNKCKPCKGTGRVGCRSCGGTGRVTCHGCRGSGHQRVWLSYAEIRRPRVLVYPQTPVAVAHPQLCEPRLLSEQEVAAFLATEVHTQGRLVLEHLPPEARPIVQRELAAIDARLERVLWQQCMRLAVVRRDVTYQMCGTTGTVALSGNPLTGASTPEATHPIRRRRFLWPALCVLLGVGGLILTSSFLGDAAYFEPTNTVVLWLWLGTMVASVPWIGGLLRSWRPVIRLRGLRPFEIGLGVNWALMLLAIVLVGVFTQPEVEDVEEALEAGDLERARLVLDGLVEQEGETPSVLELEDAVLMAEAEAAEGPARLAKLDAIVSHHGSQSEAASALARADRLAAIRALVEKRRGDEAIAAIQRDFATTWREDPELAEEWAKAEQLRLEWCSKDPCRFKARRAALKAHETPARVEALQELRERMLESLAVPAEDPDLSPVERIRLGDELASVAQETLKSDLQDDDLTAAANAAKAWAAQERAAVPMLGADFDTLLALFPGVHRTSPEIASASIEGAELFFVLDKKGQCRGVYAVGPKSHRKLDGPDWSAEKIVSQAFGKAVALVPPKDASDRASTWKEGKTKIVARWRDGVAMELRIGDAKP